MSGQQLDTEQKRLVILGDDEIETIYGRPWFTHEDRRNYFSLSQPEKDLLQVLRSVKSQAYFVLQLGYFKAKQLFFTFELHEVEEDLHYVLTQHFKDSTIDDLSPVKKLTRLKHQRLIFELINYRRCDTGERQQLEIMARKAATVCGKPIYIFREIMHYLTEQHIVVPGYSFMQETVGKALSYEENRLTAIMQEYLKQPNIEALKQLLQDSSGPYQITQLKHEPKDFSAGQIKSEIQRGKRTQPLYQLAQILLPKLGVSNESVKYYASLVGYYSVFRLKRLNEWIVYVYLLCFVYHRYQKVHDNLINTLIYNVKRYSEEAKGAAKERVYECHIEINQNLNKAGQVLKLFTDDSIATNTPFQNVQTKAFAILERQKLVDIADQIATKTKFDETAFQWEHIEKLSHQFKRHLRPILLTVDFAAPLANDPLIEAINFLKMAFLKGRPLGQYSSDSVPKGFVPNGSKRYVYEQNNPLVDRYEFLVYRLLRNGLEAGNIFCRDSVRFRSFEDDLMDDQQWQHKEKLIAYTGLSILNRPIQEQLADLEQRLEDRIAEVNRRIISGDNKHFKITKRGGHNRWTLQYPRDSDPVNHSFFDALKQIEIGNILHFVNQQCTFIDAFEHVLGRYTKQVRNDHIVVACLIAWGTNMGLGRMGEISDINYSLLAATSDNFIRLETLKEANDRVSNATHKLPLFRHYDIDEVLHFSSDGQKFETRTDTINSRHSPKYFGLKK